MTNLRRLEIEEELITLENSYLGEKLHDEMIAYEIEKLERELANN